MLMHAWLGDMEAHGGTHLRACYLGYSLLLVEERCCVIVRVAAGADAAPGRAWLFPCTWQRRAVGGRPAHRPWNLGT